VLDLSERLGVSRSSFYWYFKNRDELLDALLDRWDRLNTRSIVSEAEAPAATVNEAVCNVFRCWVNPAIFSPRLDFAVREWARRSVHVRKALDRSDRVRTEAVKALFVRFGYEDEDAFVRARVLYYMQIGYYALDLREPIEARLNLTPHYLKAFTGVGPSEAEVDAFRAYAMRHAHIPDFDPSRGRP
jgi:AcrR family transcriptional regulator